MAATEMNTEIRSDVEPERVGLVWMDAEQAMIARWRGEPTVERLASDVPPKRQAMGSVRRGPARPSGGGRVPGHGTEGRHRDLLRRYFADLVGRVADLDVIEVTGRGLPYRQFAELFRQLASRRNADVEVRTRRMSRRPTEPQLAARLREMVGEQLPRRTAGSNQWTEARDTTASGRRTGLSSNEPGNPKRRPLPERREIELEVEIMLANNPVAV